MTGAAWLRPAVAAAVIHLALILPPAPTPLAEVAQRIAPELPLVLLALAVSGQAGRGIVAAALLLLVLHKTADLAMVSALGRPFNLLVDLPLVRAGIELVASATGGARAVAAMLAALAVAALGLLLWCACGVLARRQVPGRWQCGLAMLGALLLAAAAAGGIWAGNGPYAVARMELARRTAQDVRQLRLLAARDDLAQGAGLLSAIDRDVLVIFVESYGRASFDVPFHADRHLDTLRKGQDRLAGAGLAARSGFLAAPTRGGQSWLSHATFASGLWIGDQARHAALWTSERQGLFHHARRAGFRTAAVMPAITRPWPEAAAMGFDRVLAAADLGYRGRPFNWVTMPDQFTLAATDRLLRAGRDPRHLFAQVALISSHAPWVPVPRLLPWDRLGDGRIFDAMAGAGDAPDVVWRDKDRVRAACREAVDYSLQVVLGYALLHRDDPPLMIVLGDHQAAPWVAADDRPDVAIHLIGPAHLVDRAADWGLAPGLVPPPELKAIPMDRMRDLILRGFGGAGPPT